MGIEFCQHTTVEVVSRTPSPSFNVDSLSLLDAASRVSTSAISGDNDDDRDDADNAISTSVSQGPLN
jgi:hypothetical protein